MFNLPGCGTMALDTGGDGAVLLSKLKASSSDVTPACKEKIAKSCRCENDGLTHWPLGDVNVI